jgi:hypothetical protein
LLAADSHITLLFYPFSSLFYCLGMLSLLFFILAFPVVGRASRRPGRRIRSSDQIAIVLTWCRWIGSLSCRHVEQTRAYNQSRRIRYIRHINYGCEPSRWNFCRRRRWNFCRRRRWNFCRRRHWNFCHRRPWNFAVTVVGMPSPSLLPLELTGCWCAATKLSTAAP